MISLRKTMVRRCTPVLLCCLLLASCAEAPTGILSGNALLADQAFSPPTERISADDIFTLSSEMRAFLATRLAEADKTSGAQHPLIEALFMDRQVKLDYDAQVTRNAAQAFEAHAGNCLSLAILTGAMAKALGLEVRYQSVRIGEHWERDGDLLELVGHVNVSIGPPHAKARDPGFRPDWWTVDFVPEEELKGQAAEFVSEARIAAMFMNNRAAEALASNKVDEAYWWIRAAIDADPSHFGSYNTLGVVYLRKNMLDRAEIALRYALSMQPDSLQAWGNLAIVLHRAGRSEEAASIERSHPRSKSAMWLAAVDEGIRASASGNYLRARDEFERALRIDGANAEVHYRLAAAYLNLGDRRRATDHLLRAADASTTVKQRRLYATKLDLLRSAVGGLRLDPELARQN